MPTLVLSGGGLKGFDLLGAVHDDPNTYTHFVGTSIGSIIGLLLCIGWTPLGIIHRVHTRRFFERCPYQINTTYIVEFDFIATFLKEMIQDKGYDPDITFEQLHVQTSKQLYCVAFDYTKCSKHICSPTHTPQLSCIEGISRSSALPFVFPSCIVGEHLFLDGGFVEYVPFPTAVEYCPAPYTILYSEIPIQHSIHDPILTVILNALSWLFQRSIDYMLQYDAPRMMIRIPCSSSHLQFSFTLSEMLERFLIGYSVARRTRSLHPRSSFESVD